MRSYEGSRVSIWYRRADRALAKFRQNNTVVFVAKRKRIPTQTVTIVRYDLANAARDPNLRTQVVTSSGKKLNGARPVSWAIGAWEIPFNFNNPEVITGELGMLWSLRISFGCASTVAIDYASARGFACAGSFLFHIDSDDKLTNTTAERMIESTGWCTDELASDSYAKSLKIMNVAGIDDLPAILIGGDHTVSKVSRTLREHLNIKVQSEFFQPIELKAALGLPNNQ